MKISLVFRGGSWTILRGDCVMGSGVTRSTALDLALALRFQAEAQGEVVDFQVEDRRSRPRPPPAAFAFMGEHAALD